MASLSVNYTAASTNFGIPGSTAEQTDITSFLITALTAFENHNHASTRGLAVARLATATYLNDTANTFQVIGLTLNQADNDDEILSFKSSDVAHAMTADSEADTYGAIGKSDPSNGGFYMKGFCATTTGLQIDGFHTTDNTTKSTSGNAAVHVNGRLRSGTGHTACGADANLVAVKNNGTTRFLLDGDGDSHQDVGTAWTNFDAYDDLTLLNDLSVAVSREDDPIRREFAGFLKYNKEALERTKLVTFNDDTDGRPFVNMSKLTMALVGALIQTGARIRELEASLTDVRALVAGV